MASNPKKARKNPKGSKVSDECSAGQLETTEQGQTKTAEDEVELPIQTQIKNLAAVMLEHSKALETLKDVPAILSNLSSSMNLEKDCDFNIQSEQYSESDDDDVDLIDKFGDPKPIESGIEKNDDHEMLEILELSQPVNEYGDPLGEAVAKSFNRMVTNHPSKDKVEKWKEAFKTPENCKLLGVPRINTEIWGQLKTVARNGDLSLQQQASYISQGITATARLADKIFASSTLIPKDIGQDLLRMAMDIGGILGMAGHEMSIKRRTELKRHHKEFGPLCTSRNKESEWLLGDNVVDQLKASRAAANVMKPTSSSFLKNQRGHPYKSKTFYSSNNLNFKKPPFQTKGGSTYKYPRQMSNQQISKNPRQGWNQN